MDKKGSIFDIIVWIVLALVIVTFLALWIYGNSILTTAFNNVQPVVINNNTLNVTNYYAQTLGQVNSSEQTWLPIISFILIVCEALTILITNFYVKEHPLMFIPYIFITTIAVVISAIISNTYQGLLSGFAFSSTLQTFSMSNYIMNYLPYWTGVIGGIGAILLMAQIMIDVPGGGSA